MRQAMKHWTGLSNWPGTTLKAQLQSILMMGYKDFGKHNKTQCAKAWDFPKTWKKNINDDKPLLTYLRHEVLTDDIDAIVAHNGSGFDFKVLQTRLLYHGLPLLPPSIKRIDTKNVLKQHLSLFNNRLNNAGEFLCDDTKLDHEGWPLWIKTAQRNSQAMKEMVAYNIQDVDLLEKLFRRLRPLINSIPNYNLYQVGESKLCPKCGSTRLQRRGGYYGKTTTYAKYHCRDCDGWSRTDGADRNPR